ncbi:MAG TPA: hypothetical protein PKD40_10705, partial [Saprospiraceae bacterium]|nr:hypothetical protein [Saprospiraceae bacterium]
RGSKCLEIFGKVLTSPRLSPDRNSTKPTLQRKQCISDEIHAAQIQHLVQVPGRKAHTINSLAWRRMESGWRATEATRRDRLNKPV